MTARPAAVKQIDVTRAVKGAVAAGLSVARIEIDQHTGKIVIVAEGAGQGSGVNEWDEVLK